MNIINILVIVFVCLMHNINALDCGDVDGSGNLYIANSVTIVLQIKDNLNNNVNKIFVKTTYPHHLILADH